MNLQEAIFRLEEERRRFTDEDRREIATFLRRLAGMDERGPRLVTTHKNDDESMRTIGDPPDEYIRELI